MNHSTGAKPTPTIRSPTIEEVFQIVHHNIRYEFQERRPSEADLKKDPDAKAAGRHLFIPT